MEGYHTCMGVRALTPKRRKFAELVAGGSSRVEAFRQAFPSDCRGRGTERTGSKRVARQPAVIAEIERLTLLRSPHDAAAQAEHIAAKLLELSKSPDPAIALRAIVQWGKLAQAGLLKPPSVAGHRTEVSGQRVDKAQVLEELRRLYREGLGAKGQQRNELVASTNAESIQEADDQIEPDGASVSEPPLSSREEPLQSLVECPTDQDAPGEPIPREVLIDAAPESLKPDNYELVAIPGRFPVHFRRVSRRGDTVPPTKSV